jgi:hypothetical protein
LYSAVGDYEAALIHFDEAEKVFAKKAPRSLEFAKLCLALGEVFQAKQDLSNALHRFQHAASIYVCHHARGPTVEKLAEKIGFLRAQLAAESERNTGTPTAVARNVIEITQQQFPARYKDQVADSVIAWPADGYSTLGDMPIAESIIPFHTPSTEELPEISEIKDSAEVSVAGSTQTPKVEESTHIEPKDKEKARILVLHNDKLSNNWFATSSLSEKYDIINATTTTEAMMFFKDKENCPDIVISSMKQQIELGSGLTYSATAGLQLIRQIRHANYVFPIILYTTSAGEVELFKDETMRFGGNAIVSDIQSLHEAVERCLLLYSEQTLYRTESIEETFGQKSQDALLPDPYSLLPRKLFTSTTAGNIQKNTCPTQEISETQPSPALTMLDNLVQTSDVIQEHQPSELLTMEDRLFPTDRQVSDMSSHVQNQPTQLEAMHVLKEDPPGMYFPWKFDKESSCETDSGM